jgi:hypothetical protein
MEFMPVPFPIFFILRIMPRKRVLDNLIVVELLFTELIKFITVFRTAYIGP